MGRWLNLTDRCAVATAGVAAGLTFAPAFDDRSRLAIAIAAAAVAGAFLVPPVGWPRGTRQLGLLAMLGGVLITVVWIGQPVGAGALRHPGGWVTLGETLLGGIGRTLRLTLPLPPALAVVPVVLAGAAAAMGALLVRRRPGELVALVPATIVGALGVVAAGGRPSQLAPVAIGVGAAALLLIHGAAAQGGTAQRGAAQGVAARGLVAGLAVLVAALPLLWLPARPAAGTPETRDRFRTPEQPVDAVNLLDRVAGWLSTPDTEMFRAGDGTVPRWRLAVLDRYDGEGWTSSETFTPAGLGVPPYDGRGLAGTQAQRVRIAGLDGPYLPAADRPVRVSTPVTAVDAEDGILVTDRPLTAGLSYSVVSRPRTEPDVPPASGPGTGTKAQLAVPAELAADLQALTGDAGIGPELLPAQRATALLHYLQTRRRNVLTAPSAASIAAVQSFIRGGPGTTVQFAVTFALAMRAAGVPARLVVGFLPRQKSPAVLLGRDARVWVELKFAGVGWVSSQPTPAPGKADTPLSTTGSPPPTDVTTVAIPDPEAVVSPGRIPHSRPVLAGLVAVVAALLLALLLAPLVRRWTRRLRPGTPAERIVRAWHDVLDELAIDVGPARSMTPADVRRAIDATAAGGRTTDESRRLAVLVDNALFGYRESTVDDQRQAWRAAARLRKTLRRCRRPRDRWRRLLLPARWELRARPGRGDDRRPRRGLRAR